MRGGMRWLALMGIGAGVMYLLDPEKGPQRQRQLRDQVNQFMNRTQSNMGSQAQYYGDMAKGKAYETKAELEHQSNTLRNEFNSTTGNNL